MNRVVWGKVLRLLQAGEESVPRLPAKVVTVRKSV